MPPLWHERRHPIAEYPGQLKGKALVQEIEIRVRLAVVNPWRRPWHWARFGKRGRRRARIGESFVDDSAAVAGSGSGE